MSVFTKSLLASIGLVFFVPLGAAAQYCTGSICTVPAPVTTPGTYDDANIAAVIEEAETGNFAVIQFPAGTYTVTSSIVFNDTHYDLAVRGAGMGSTIIEPAIVNPSNPDVPFFPIFNLARGNAFTAMDFEISGFTIDMDDLRAHPSYLDDDPDVTTGNAHGIRVGEGWGATDPDGKMLIKDMEIKGAPGYGIGIQTRGRDEPASNLWIENVKILDSGSDGIDTKESDAGEGQNLTMIGVVVNGFGLNEKSGTGAVTYAKAFDLRYQTIYMEKVSAIGEGIVTAAHGGNQTRNDGINFRDAIAHGTKQAGKLAVVRDFYVKGTDNAVNFGNAANTDVIMTNFILKDYRSNGISIRGSGHVFEHGCILPGNNGNANFVNYVAGQYTPGTITENYATGAYDADHCPAYTDVGFGAY